MIINSSLPVTRASFGSDFTYKDRYFPHKQDQTVDVIRAHFEEKLGSDFYYLDQVSKETDINQAKVTLYIQQLLNEAKAKKKEKPQINSKSLSTLGISAFRERKKNEIYSGEHLAYKPEVLKSLKEAGIKSVFCLVPQDEYKDRCKEAGLNYLSLRDINGTGLSVFDINGDLIKNLIKDPASYANIEQDEKIECLKVFVKTMKGENPEIPFPMYFGCHNGTDRTYFWYLLFNILKDHDMDKPLTPEIVQKLAEFAEDVDNHYRW